MIKPVFTHLRGHFRCEICPNQVFHRLSKAKRHEHVRVVRTRDRPTAIFSSPLRVEEGSRRVLSNYAPKTPPSQLAGPSTTYPANQDPTTTRVPRAELDAHWEEIDLLAMSPTPVGRSTAKTVQLQTFSDSEESDNEQSDFTNFDNTQSATMHGPALPGDDNTQLYDDWGGTLASSKPQNPEIEKSYGAGQEVNSDDEDQILADERDEDIEGGRDAYLQESEPDFEGGRVAYLQEA